ncbi:MAG: hypothetical protein R3E68_06230 [Burkholderiaceae bacterium]
MTSGAELLADAAHWQSVARDAAPACDAWSLRVVAEDGEHLLVRQDIVQAPSLSRDLGR